MRRKVLRQLLRQVAGVGGELRLSADCDMPEVRRAQANDLGPLLDLFRVSEVSASAEPTKRVERIWNQMLCRDGLTLFVAEADSKIVATCTLITAPNLLRSGRQHAFLENVVTHPGFRGRGF